MEPAADPTIRWAHDHAQELLEPLGRRWLHTEAVAQTAREIARSLDPADGHALVAAAYVHDIGYAPSLAITGFHPLDGACHLHHRGHPRLAGLVAHDTRHEAAIRGHHRALAVFDDEASIVTAALAYCDLTHGPDGQSMTLHQRRRDTEQRYGPDSPVVASLHTAWPELVTVPTRIEQLQAPPTQRKRVV